jgi:hypothetical protein
LLDVAAHKVEHNVDIMDNRIKCGCGVINRFINAKLAQKINIDRRRADHRCAAQPGKLHRNMTDPTTVKGLIPPVSACRTSQGARIRTVLDELDVGKPELAVEVIAQRRLEVFSASRACVEATVAFWTYVSG